MKLNVKGLVFVGFAAAILSAANANAAEKTDAEKKQTVTSEYYVEQTYQKKIGGGDDADKVVIAGSTAGSPTYKAISNSKDDIVDNNNKAGVLVDAQAIAQAIGDSTTATTYTADETTITLDDHEFQAKTGDISEDGTGLVTSGTLYTEFAKKQDKQVGAAPVGNADSADTGKLMIVGTDGKIAMAPDTLDVGTATKGVYILDGVPTATTYSVGMNVPTASNVATQFLDGTGNWSTPIGTTYGNFTAETATNANDAVDGLVDAPSFADKNKFLAGDGSWAVPDWNAASGAKGYIDNKPGAFGGSQANSAGTQGFVPAPAQNTLTSYLKSNGNWQAPSTTPTSGSNDLITSGAVYTALALGTMPTTCTTGTKNCALVATGDGAGGTTFAWVEMAQ